MNKNWKKLVSLLLSLACVLAMSAVSVFAESNSTPAYLPVEESTLENMLTTSEALIDELCAYGDEELEALKASEYQFTSRAVEAWQSTKDELGALVSYDTEDSSYEVEGEFVTCTIPAEFEKNPATIRVFWNMASQQATQATDMTFTVESSKSELMGEAGMNTVVGLVTVFAVLIFLILVIMAFGKMGGNKNQEPAKEKKAAPAPAPAAPAAAPVVAAQPQDDIELQIVLGMAIAMYEQETGAAGGDGYVVRSIRKNRKNNWKRA